MERRVVIGVDETSESWAALHWAAQESLFRNLPLRIVHVYKGSRRHDLRYAEDGHDVFDAAMGFAHTRLGMSRVTGALVSGEPVSALLAESVGAELLVLGSTRSPDPVSVALTSVSAELARQATCPVLVVRGKEPWPRVLVGVEHPDRCSNLLEFAFDETGERCQRLSVVHCFDGSTRTEFDQEQTLGDRLAVLERKNPDVLVTTEFVEDDPAAFLVERSRHAGLVVVGRSHHGRGLLTGSVSQRVLYGASCSVAVVREQ